MEDQLQKAKYDLAQAESELKSTQERTGLIALSDQAKAIIENVAKLRAQIAAAEVKLQSMRSFATPQNPDLIRLQSELSAMRAQLASAEKNGMAGDGNVMVPTGKIPSAGLQYADKLRNVKFSEAMVELIGKQYEFALLDESNTVLMTEVLDKASVPEKKSKPKRALIVVLTTLTAAFVGIALAFVREHFSQVASDPIGSEKLNRLRSLILPTFRFKSRIRI
jgi:tyrosine-protein kinase Etk/Wzc